MLKASPDAFSSPHRVHSTKYHLMHKPSMHTAYPSVSHDIAASSTWTKGLKSESAEEGNDWTLPKMKKLEPQIVTELKPQMDNVVSSNSRIKALVACQNACATEQMMAETLQPFFSCMTSCNVRTGTHSLESAPPSILLLNWSCRSRT